MYKYITHITRNMADIPNCIICDEKHNKSTHKIIKCQYCNFCCCKKCCQTYILNQPIVRCMNNECAKEWTRQYIRSVLPLSFINKELKEHKEQILFDQERALMPATQPLIERRIKIDSLKQVERELNGDIGKIRLKISENARLLNILLYGRDTGEERTAVFVRACPSEDCRGFLSTQWKCGICQKWTCPHCHILKGDDRDCEHTCNPDDVATAELLNKDTKPCPKCGIGIFKIDGCFSKDVPILMWDGTTKISQDIKIGDILVGDDGIQRNVLRLMQGEDELYLIRQQNAMDYIVNSKHTLTLINSYSNNVIEIRVDEYLNLKHSIKTFLMGYKKDGSGQFSRTDIEVISIGNGKYYGWEVDSNHRFLLSDSTTVMNCNQMFCVQCHTAFDWRTGHIETNRIHNPHYFEWMRINGTLDRNHDDVICGRELEHRIFNIIYSTINSKIAKKNHMSKEEKLGFLQKAKDIVETGRFIIHMQQVELPYYAYDYELNNQELRVQYMRNYISEIEFKNKLQIQNKKHYKHLEIRNVLQLVIDSMTDIFLRFHKEIRKHDWDLDFSIINEADALRQYANDCLSEISKTYGCVKLRLNNIFILRSERVEATARTAQTLNTAAPNPTL
jgi:hypothetical protein